ncbi:hypothetical protein GCM10009753_63910 [Streptantibioticus ferralitis]
MWEGDGNRTASSRAAGRPARRARRGEGGTSHGLKAMGDVPVRRIDEPTAKAADGPRVKGTALHKVLLKERVG